MTEQTTDAPKPAGFGLLSVNEQPYRNPDTLTRGDLPAEKIREIIETQKVGLIAEGKFAPHEVETAFDVMYGSFLATNRERAAEIRQETATHIALALSSAATPNHTASMFRVVEINDRIAQSAYGRSERLSHTWADLRAQCGIITTCMTAGIKIHIPANTPGAPESRIAAWSIRGKTDMVVRKGNQIALIQVAGSQENEVTPHRQTWNVNEVPVQLQALLRALGKSPKDSLPHITFTIPDFGARNWIVHEDPRGEPKDYQTALRSRLTLREEVQRGIIDQLTRGNL